MIRHAPRALAVLAAGLLATTSCRNGPSQREPKQVGLPSVPAGSGEQAWYAGSEQMRAEIRGLVAKLEGSGEKERLGLAKRLSEYGEPSVPILVEALKSHPGPITRGTAAYVLGFMGDPRALPALKDRMADPDADVRHEVSAAMLRLGDDHGLEGMVAGLEDPDPRVRLRCILVLRDATGDTFGFKAIDDPQDRAAAVLRWRAWLERRRSQAE